MFVSAVATPLEAGTNCTDGNWSYMTATDILEKRRAALRDYAERAKANPAGARDRLIATGIYTKAGKLKPEYGGEPAKRRA
jgi:hypothetical protein